MCNDLYVSELKRRHGLTFEKAPYSAIINMASYYLSLREKIQFINFAIKRTNYEVSQKLITYRDTLYKKEYLDLDTFWELLDNSSSSFVDKFIVALFRYGCSNKVICELKWSDIDEDEMCINLNRFYYNNVEVDLRFIDLMHKAKNCFLYREDSLKYSLRTIIYTDSEYCFKLREGETVRSPKRLCLRFNKVFKTNSRVHISKRLLMLSRIYDLIIEEKDLKGTVTKDDFTGIMEMYDNIPIGDNIVYNKIINKLYIKIEEVS